MEIKQCMVEVVYKESGTFTMSGGTITGNNGGSVSGSYASYGNEANSNEVNITGGTINCDISGGYGRNDASNNKINISGGIVNKSTDADGEEGIYGGNSDPVPIIMN